LRKKYSLEDLETLLPLKTWWASICVLPLSNRIAVSIANDTKITPNQITLISFFLRILAAFAFIKGTRNHLVLGAFCYYLAYLLDCTDGLVARLTGTSSEFGRYLDHVSDLIGDLLILTGLAYGQKLLLHPVVLAMMFAHITEYYVSFLTSNIISNRREEKLKSTNVVLTLINRYRNFFFQRNFKSFLSFPDYEALVFIFFPLAGHPVMGIKAGFYLVLLIVSYTIFSSFVTIMTGGNKFP